MLHGVKSTQITNADQIILTEVFWEKKSENDSPKNGWIEKLMLTSESAPQDGDVSQVLTGEYFLYLFFIAVSPWRINSFNATLEQTTSVVIFLKTEVWMGKCMKKTLFILTIWTIAGYSVIWSQVKQELSVHYKTWTVHDPIIDVGDVLLPSFTSQSVYKHLEVNSLKIYHQILRPETGREWLDCLC
jgi:hypothetical protein